MTNMKRFGQSQKVKFVAKFSPKPWIGTHLEEDDEAGKFRCGVCGKRLEDYWIIF